MPLFLVAAALFRSQARAPARARQCPPQRVWVFVRASASTGTVKFGREAEAWWENQKGWFGRGPGKASSLRAQERLARLATWGWRGCAEVQRHLCPQASDDPEGQEAPSRLQTSPLPGRICCKNAARLLGFQPWEKRSGLVWLRGFLAAPCFCRRRIRGVGALATPAFPRPEVGGCSLL